MRFKVTGRKGKENGIKLLIIFATGTSGDIPGHIGTDGNENQGRGHRTAGQLPAVDPDKPGGCHGGGPLPDGADTACGRAGYESQAWQDAGGDVRKPA